MFLPVRVDTVYGFCQAGVSVQEVRGGHYYGGSLASLQGQNTVLADLASCHVPCVILFIGHCTLAHLGAVAVIVRVGHAEHAGVGAELVRLDTTHIHVFLVGQPDTTTQLVIEQPNIYVLGGFDLKFT